MAPMKQKSNYGSSNYGEGVVPNVLATCYIVDSVGSLKGLHYCSTSGTGMCSIMSRWHLPSCYHQTLFAKPLAGAEWYS